MKILIIVFIVIAIVASLSSLTYVTADIVVEKKNEKKEKNQPKPENDLNQSDAAQAAPAPENEVFPELVESVDAKKADELLSNSLALSTVKREKGAGVGKLAVVNIGDIDRAFDRGAVVTLAALKTKGLVPKSAGRVKILAGGDLLTKPLTVKAESFSIQAIKMIELTGGTVVIKK